MKSWDLKKKIKSMLIKIKIYLSFLNLFMGNECTRFEHLHTYHRCDDTMRDVFAHTRPILFLKIFLVSFLIKLFVIFHSVRAIKV